MLARRLLVISAAFASLALAGCETTRNFINPPEPKKPTSVCNKVSPPREVPLNTFTFFPLPDNTTGEGGVPLFAGVSADGVSAILGNHATLKKREEEWLGRMKAINECLEREAKERADANKRR
jgi:hypothetical protein